MTSFIIVNFNTAELAKNCLSSLLAKTAVTEREIIVVDNASTDNSPALLTAAFGTQIKLIANSVNLGFAAANNIGARAASGDILWFLNSDTLITADIISPLRSALNDNPKIGIIAPTLLSADGQPQAFAYGRFPKLFSLIFNKLFPFSRFRSSGNLKFVDWVSGAALAIRKDVFTASGGWDEKYFLYFEDIDLCWRVKRIGREVAISDKIFITHLGGRSLARDRDRKKHYYSAQAYFFRKNYGAAAAAVLKLIRWPYKMFKSL